MQAWVPVAFAAIIVVGVVGGQLAQMVLKELLPLLRTMTEQRRQAVSPVDAAQIAETLAAVERRLERLEAGQARIEEDREFTRRLLDRQTIEGQA